MNFNRFYINTLAIIITSIIFIIIILSPLKIPLLIINQKEKDTIKIAINNIEKVKKSEETKNNIKIQTNNKNEPMVWKIFIPSLNMNANIKNGTNLETVSKSVGHYEITGIKEGKIALYALNSGDLNIKKYFSNLKELKLGEKVYYTTDERMIEYEVISNKIVKNDIETINQINYSCLILITNVIDMPNAKRCVITIQK